MALKATIFKVNLSICDLNQHYYDDLALTVAQHPSENERRMMFRIVLFALHAKEKAIFTKGLCTQDEPELWTHNLIGEIEHWIELGTPDLKRIKQACGKARKVTIYTYQERASIEWFESLKTSLERFNNLTIIHLKQANGIEIEALASRSMDLSVTIQDQEICLANDAGQTCLMLS